MAICWYCTWGWAKEVSDIYKKYLNLIGDDSPLQYGPGHIIWSDENFGMEQTCIDSKYEDYSDMMNKETFDLVIESLKELQKVPLEIRACCPDGYDDEHPENYPPPKNIIMIKGY